ncbi:MAG: hypothetical protein ACFFBQ_21195 [Promethearchaeota archaeon]
MKISPQHYLNLIILLILGSLIVNNLFSFDLFWTEPMETYMDFSEQTNIIESIQRTYPLKIIQAKSLMYYGIWYILTEGAEDLYFFGSTDDHNHWSTFTPLDEIFSEIEGNLRNYDLILLENSSIALFGIVSTSQFVNGTWITNNSLVMSLSDDGGLSWSQIVRINSINLRSSYFGVYLDEDIKFWIIEQDSGGDVIYIRIWSFNESTTSIIQTNVYQPETNFQIYWGAVTFNHQLIFLERKVDTNYLLIFDGAKWIQMPISLTEVDLERFTVIRSGLYLIYTSENNAFCIGKVGIDGTNAKITSSTKITAGLNWDLIWPILNSTIPTFFVTTNRNDIASVRNSFNWSTVIFILAFSLIFILIWLASLLSSTNFVERKK